MSLGSSSLGSTALGASTMKMARDSLDFISKSDSPSDTAKEILELLREVSKTNKYSDLENNKKYHPLKKWIPDTPEKLAAYAGIIALIFHLIQLNVEPRKIEINNTFIEQHKTIINNNSYFEEIGGL